MRNRSDDDKEMEERFYQLYQEKYDQLLGFAVTIFHQFRQENLGDGRIEEVVQETFAVAWANRKRMFASGNPGGWLYKALRFKIQEQLREEAKWHSAIQAYEENGPAFSDPGDSFMLDIQSALTAEEYRLICEVYIEGRSYAELSRKYQISLSTLASRIRRIKLKLRKFLR